MKTIIPLQSNLLQALRLFVSKDETRYVLNGVLLEVVSPSQFVLAATDGRSLFAVRIAEEEMVTDDPFEPFQVIMPIELLKKITGKARLFHVELDCSDDGSEMITLRDVRKEITYSQKAIVGDHPKWRQTCPTAPCGHPKYLTRYNAEFAQKFSKAAQILGVAEYQGITLRQVDTNGVMLVEAGVQWSGYDCVAILMPMGMKDKTNEALELSTPSWAIAPVLPTPEIVETPAVETPSA